MNRVISLKTACTLFIAAGACGQCDPLWSVEGKCCSSPRLGHACWNVGDLNGDGVDDVLAELYCNTNGSTGTAIASGVDGAWLQYKACCCSGKFWAEGLGDLDGDGIAEWLWENGGGTLSLISGVDIVLRTWNTGGSYSVGFFSCGDIDGDAVADFAVGDDDAGFTRLYSGATQSEIAQLGVVAIRGKSLGDLSGDGVGDFIITSARGGIPGPQVYSGSDLALLYTLADQIPGDGVVPVGDADADGAADFVYCDPTDMGRVALVSGANGSTLLSRDGEFMQPIDGIAAAGDWNGDGVLDIGVCCPWTRFVAEGAGRLEICSGSNLAVLARIDGEASGQPHLGSSACLLQGLSGSSGPVLAVGSDNYGGFDELGRLQLYPWRCRADFNCDDTANTQDVLAFLNAFVADDPRADTNFDNVVNTQDVLAFLNLWAAGCG